MAAKVACSPGSCIGSKSEQACWVINLYSRVNINTMEQDYKPNIYIFYLYSSN